MTRRPAIVWAHGGAFIAGDKAVDPATTLAQEFARMGYVTVSINYRLITGTFCTGLAITEQCREAVINSGHDAQAAVRWLRANADRYGIDPDRIARGAHRPAPCWPRRWAWPPTTRAPVATRGSRRT